MTERATFKYTGPDQHVRIGSETFPRHIDVLTTDPDVIAEARKHPEFSEAGTFGASVPAAQVEAAQAAEAEPVPPSAEPVVPAPAPVAKPKTAPKRKH